MKKGNNTAGVVRKLVKFSEDSKQKTRQSVVLGNIIKPDIAFSNLENAYDNSFILSAIAWKVGTACNSGFEEIKNEKLRRIMNDLDVINTFINLYVFGNCFLEKVKNKKGEVLELEPFITSQVSIEKEENGRIKGYRQADGQTSSGIFFPKEDVVHTKLPNLKDKYFGDTPVSKVVTQVVLLSYIDEFYEKYFEGGLISPFLLTYLEGKLTDKQLESIELMIQDGLRGKDNAFSGLIVQANMEKVEMGNKIETEKHVELRRELTKSIAMGLLIPYGLLINDSSNRATYEGEMETFNKEVIKPLQEYFLQQFRKAMRGTDGITDSDLDELKFISVDIKNQKDDMEVMTGYKKNGIITSNEVREYLGYKKMTGEGNEDADKLITSTGGIGKGNADTPQDVIDGIDKIYKKLRK